MSQVKTKLRNAKVDKAPRAKQLHGEYHTVKSHRVKGFGSNEYLAARETKNQSYRDKVSACKLLLDKISVSIYPF